jgi:hypothetical protein
MTGAMHLYLFRTYKNKEQRDVACGQNKKKEGKHPQVRTSQLLS